jgi:phosphoribosylaminoimidazole-succinocarboxamide synthase
VLTQLSHFWFDRMAGVVPNHRLAGAGEPLPEGLRAYSSQLGRRSMVVKKATPLTIECVVRGYLAGSGWKEYRKNQTVCGIALPAGLVESSELPEPIFTPATKAEEGHDENISFEHAAGLVGKDVAEKVREFSLTLYGQARAYARERGIIIADTKFEFGLLNGELILIDEVLTPDSSRFWPANEYKAGRGQPSFDKQFVRDYLETVDWDKAPPGPMLPAEVVLKSQAKYLEAYSLLTGKAL